MPMKKISTQLPSELLTGKNSEKMNPKQSTINFLKQFARVYTCNNKLPQGLEGFIVN